MSEEPIEAPRITPAQIEAVIEREEYYRFPDTTVTICLLHLVNGFSVVGESACVSPANFIAEVGQAIAKENAKQKIWALEGYALAERLWMGVRN